MFTSRKRTVLASFFFTFSAFLLLAAKNVFDYGAPPLGPKHCSFIFPAGGDPGKPTHIVLTATRSSLALEQEGGYDTFFSAKRTYDPAELFSNKFYEKYGRTK